MPTERDDTRIVRSWLRTDEHESADRVLDAVLALLDTTPQRRSWLPARRTIDMNTFAKLALAAAAVLIIAVVGISRLPASGGAGGGGPAPTPSPAPSATPVPPTPSPTHGAVLPPAGDLAIGRHSLTLAGVPFSIAIPASGWVSNGDFAIDKGVFPSTRDGGFILWNSAPDAIFTDPCGQVQGPRIGTSLAAHAEAAASVPGTVATGPTDVTVGGYPAKLVVVEIPAVAKCSAEGFYLWWDEQLTGRYATELGSTIRVWIIDVDGTLIWIDGETAADAPPEVGQEIQQIIDSIQFE